MFCPPGLAPPPGNCADTLKVKNKRNKKMTVLVYVFINAF